MEKPSHIDPVCGMTVTPTPDALRAEHEGATYYFCAPSCRERFEADPTRYLDPEKRAAAGAEAAAARVDAPPGTIWVCPMDPEVRQDHPCDRSPVPG